MDLQNFGPNLSRPKTGRVEESVLRLINPTKVSMRESEYRTVR